MTRHAPPPFDPSRIPPDSLDHARQYLGRSIPVDEAHALLGIAWRAYDRVREQAESGPLLRQPACTERCTGCSLECAVILSGLQMAHRDYLAAMAAAGPVLSFDGAVYPAMAGRA